MHKIGLVVRTEVLVASRRNKFGSNLACRAVKRAIGLLRKSKCLLLWNC